MISRFGQPNYDSCHSIAELSGTVQDPSTMTRVYCCIGCACCIEAMARSSDDTLLRFDLAFEFICPIDVVIRLDDTLHSLSSSDYFTDSNNWVHEVCVKYVYKIMIPFFACASGVHQRVNFVLSFTRPEGSLLAPVFHRICFVMVKGSDYG